MNDVKGQSQVRGANGHCSTFAAYCVGHHPKDILDQLTVTQCDETESCIHPDHVEFIIWSFLVNPGRLLLPLPVVCHSSRDEVVPDKPTDFPIQHQL